jgi:hypothetical protein
MSERRWEKWIESAGNLENLKILWEGKEWLKTAWEKDRMPPTSYPMNTSYALAVIEERLSRRPPSKNTKVRLSKSRPPTTMADLVPEKFIKSIWEDHHSGTFRDALRQAAGFDHEGQRTSWEESWKAFQGIMHAMKLAYLFEADELPRPKVNILHRRLDQIAKAAGLGGLTEEGFAEFLDNLCPCGLRRHKEAVRKLSSRSPRMRRPKA